MVVLDGDGDDESPTRDAPGDPARGADLPRGAERVGANCERFGGLTDPSIPKRDANVKVGPLTFVSLHEYTRQPARDFEPVQPVEEGEAPRYLAQKVIVLVRGDRDATVVVPQAERANASLLWGRTPGITRAEERKGWAQIADGHPAVRFKGCPGEFMEYVGGGFVIAGARCLPLDVWIEGENAQRRIAALFGVLKRCA